MTSVDFPTPAQATIVTTFTSLFAHARSRKAISSSRPKTSLPVMGNLDTEIFSGVSPRGAIYIACRFASNPALPSPSRLCSEGLCEPPAASSFSTEDLSALALRRSRCQPSNMAGTNPRRSTSRTTFMLQPGSSRLGNTIAATWRITQALTM